jgi:autotransporter-associated beta strand protein
MKTPTKRTAHRLAASIAIVLELVAAQTAQAKLWKGNGSNTLWSTPENWESSTVPAATESLAFRQSGAPNKTVTIDSAFSTSGNVHVGNGSSAEEPYIFEATDPTYGLTIQDDVWLGYHEAGWLWIKSGTYVFGVTSDKGMQIGNGSNNFWLKVGDGTTTASLTATTKNVNMYASSVLIADKATLDFNGLLMNGTSTAYITNTTMNVSGDFSVGNDSDSTGKLTINGGTVTWSRDGYVFKAGNGQNSTGAVELNDCDVSCYYLRLGTENGASGVFTMNGGTLTVNRNSNNHFSIGYGSGATGEFNLNGGTVTAIGINAFNGTGTLKFNGGTLMAREAGTLIVDSANLTVTVGEKGGMIDSDNKAITIAKAIGGTGAMTYKGGNTITLTGAANYTGGTTIEGGTCVVVADRAAATALIGSALKVTLPATQLMAGSHALVTITGTEAEDVFTAEDVAKVAFASGVKVSGCYSFALSTDSKSIMYTDRLSADTAYLVFPGKTLADLATHTLRARMGGYRIDADGVEVTFFGRDEKRDVDNNLTNVTYQLQTLDEVSGHHYTKSTKVEFTADGDGVWAKIASGQFTNYGAQNAFGTDPLTTNPSANEYIPYDLRIVEPVTNSINVNFTYNNNNLNTSSSVRYGGGDYAVPYSAWENMSAANGSATIGGATWTISNGAGHCESTSLSATKDLRHGYIGDSDTYTTPTVTVTDVPYEAYRVVVYASAQDADSTYGHVTVNGRNYTASGDALNSDTGDSVTTVEGDGAWGKDNAGSGSNAYGLKEGLNYLVSYVTGGTTATIVGHRTASTSIHGGIAAIQIVKVDALEDGDILPLKVENGSLERTSMSVALPTVGAATLNITGGRLGSGNHVLFTGVAADALDHLTVNIAPEVIDGRKYSLKVDGSNLVLNILSPGLMVIIR